MLDSILCPSTEKLGHRHNSGIPARNKKDTHVGESQNMLSARSDGGVRVGGMTKPSTVTESRSVVVWGGGDWGDRLGGSTTELSWMREMLCILTVMAMIYIH